VIKRIDLKDLRGVYELDPERVEVYASARNSSDDPDVMVLVYRMRPRLKVMAVIGALGEVITSLAERFGGAPSTMFEMLRDAARSYEQHEPIPPSTNAPGGHA